MLNNTKQATFHDGRTFTAGDRVSFSARFGDEGTGTVLGVRRPRRGPTRILIAPDDASQDYRVRISTGSVGVLSAVGLTGGCLEHL